MAVAIACLMCLAAPLPFQKPLTMPDRPGTYHVEWTHCKPCTATLRKDGTLTFSDGFTTGTWQWLNGELRGSVTWGGTWKYTMRQHGSELRGEMAGESPFTILDIKFKIVTRWRRVR